MPCFFFQINVSKDDSSERVKGAAEAFGKSGSVLPEYFQLQGHFPCVCIVLLVEFSSMLHLAGYRRIRVNMDRHM